MISRWVILNLPKRADRRDIAVSTALRLGVPPPLIDFWHGHDFADFQSFEAMKSAMVADGMGAILDVPRTIPEFLHGKVAMMWNVARYLRALSKRNTIEALIHDGVLFGKPLSPSFQWMQDVVAEIVAYDPDFKMLTFGLNNGWLSKLKKIDTITPSSVITRGILSWDNYARIYSSKGAHAVLERIFSSNWAVEPNSVLVPRPTDKDNTWEEGFYSTILPLGSDFPSSWLGSDSMPNLNRGYLGQFERLMNTGAAE